MKKNRKPKRKNDRGKGEKRNMGKLKNFAERIGYFCRSCNRYKKTFAPPFGRRVCLSCQLEDVNEHGMELDDIICQRGRGDMSDAVLAGRLDDLRDRFLPSKEERELKKARE